MRENWSGLVGVFNFASRRAAGKFNTCKQTKIVRVGFLRNTRCDTLFVGSYRTHLSAIQPWFCVCRSNWTIPWNIWNFLTYFLVCTPTKLQKFCLWYYVPKREDVSRSCYIVFTLWNVLSTLLRHSRVLQQYRDSTCCTINSIVTRSGRNGLVPSLFIYVTFVKYSARMPISRKLKACGGSNWHSGSSYLMERKAGGFVNSKLSF